MKDASITIEYVTHCLASGRQVKDGYDEFEKDSSGNIIWKQSWWYAALMKSIELAGVKGIKPAHFHFNPVITAETEAYKRKYGRDRFRTHEAIFPGTKVTFEAVVDDIVTESAVEKIFKRMGKYVGLSPYGHNLGYGMFEVDAIEVESSIKNKE